MLFAAHYFWRHISWRSTCIVGVVLPELSRDSQIRDSYIALRVQNQIFRFDVPVDNLVLVHVLQADNYVSDEELGFLLVEVPLIAEVVAEISAVEVIHHEIEVLLILEGVGDVDKEGVHQFAEEFLLVHHGSHRLLVYYLHFAHLFHREHLLVLLSLHLPHLPEPSLTDWVQHVEHLP